MAFQAEKLCLAEALGLLQFILGGCSLSACHKEPLLRFATRQAKVTLVTLTGCPGTQEVCLQTAVNSREGLVGKQFRGCHLLPIIQCHGSGGGG